MRTGLATLASQMTRPDEETCTCSLAGLMSKLQARDAGLVGIGLARVVFVTISISIHTESMQAAAGAGAQTRRPEAVPR